MVVRSGVPWAFHRRPPPLRKLNRMPLSPIRVLVVHDSPCVAGIIALTVRVLGCSVRIACNGAAAARSARLSRPDLVLLHLALPGIGAYECARRLRAQPESANAVIVALTPRHQPDLDVSIIDLEFVEPIGAQRLHRLLRAIAEMRRRALPMGAGTTSPDFSYGWAGELHRQAHGLMMQARKATGGA